ncbi:hypothetical protein CKAH01_09120 [Colletotrichum kahawae]|uniref:Uncharacterized protein n=1 Tax=Colletotrichum kahawae TaxID=34407 RepID=A0AAE0CZH9_COLKA|nr:hypothetical protein CKAH01_09120 [Colletotrichum kahawae]
MLQGHFFPLQNFSIASLRGALTMTFVPATAEPVDVSSVAIVVIEKRWTRDHQSLGIGPDCLASGASSDSRPKGHPCVNSSAHLAWNHEETEPLLAIRRHHHHHLIASPPGLTSGNAYQTAGLPCTCEGVVSSSSKLDFRECTIRAPIASG